MNLIRSKQSIVTRQVRSNSGVELIVRFLVIETESGIDVRVLSAVPVAAAAEAGASSASTPLISSPITISVPSDVIVYPRISKTAIVNDLGFFYSQPTRAPSLFV